MSHPEYLYYAAIYLVVLPSAFINRAAAIVLLTWLAGHVAVLLGADFRWVDLVQHGVALCLAARLCQGSAANLVAGLFVPMVAVDVFRLTGELSLVPAWWAILGLAFAQVAVIPFGNDWALAKEGLDGLRDMSWVEHLFRRTAHVDRGSH